VTPQRPARFHDPQDFESALHVWQAAGLEERAGLTTWRPYEYLKPDVQEAMLHTVGTALRLAADGSVIACGRLASTLRPEYRHLYDGDRPRRGSWEESMARIEKTLALARTDRDTARQLLTLLTLGCRTLDRFEEERAFLIGVGVPADFLPTAGELGHTDPA
ncbi:hypothetical protein, partial [Streptomyces noursei]